MNETTYTTTVGHEYATWLASRTEGPASQDSSIHITDNGDGTVSFGEGTFGALALLPEHYDGVISTGEGAAVMWIEGDPYEVQENWPWPCPDCGGERYREESPAGGPSRWVHLYSADLAECPRSR